MLRVAVNVPVAGSLSRLGRGDRTRFGHDDRVTSAAAVGGFERVAVARLVRPN